jgi:cell division cycle 20-like protein 1 (cofactor of APC complex)
MNINLWDSMNTRSSSSKGRNSNNHHGDSSNNNDDGNGGNHHRSASDETNTSTTGGSNPAATAAAASGGRTNDSASGAQLNLHNILLRSELLGENISPHNMSNGNNRFWGGSGNSAPPILDGASRLRFQGPRQAFHENVFFNNESNIGHPTSVVNSFSLTPFGSASSQRLMAAPQKRRRKIAKVPFKVLDAPALQDDFYLNLVDWSSQNVLAVGLGSCVYLWSACTSKVTKLCDLAQSEDIVTSVSWAQRGTHLAVGTNKGEVQLWDAIKVKKVRTMSGHSARVGTLAWSGPSLASGSRDRLIYLRDVRVQTPFTDRLSTHRQEVCGLKWSFDEPAFLASGGNDNQLHVVDSRNPAQPVHRFSDHTAAVKAIAWSPHQHGLLASGGGTADRCIRFWNTLSGSALSSVDTGSQVCNLAWSQNCNEIVSTHGYSLNQIVVWRYPSLSKVVTLTGHTYRVLYLAVSPDGSTIVTGAGDETLRFWQVFPGPRSDAKNNSGGLLFPNTLGSVIR